MPCMLDESKNLGLAMLLAESEEGQYEPVAVVGSLREAREVAEFDYRTRNRRLQAGESPFCPGGYKVWAGTEEGYRTILEIIP
jgi:hypothetical protein